MSDPTAYTLQAKRPPVNWRSLLLGLLGVVFVCAITPYNDSALNNTLFVGTYMPTGLLLFMLPLILLVNGPLSRWWPRAALNLGELSVILSMILVSCGLPGAGLMDYLPGSMVGMHYHATSTADYRKVLEQANLPDWILPTFQSKKVAERVSEPVIGNFWNRTPREQEGWRAFLAAVPWKLWRTPAIGWALLLVPMFGSYLFLSTILRRQWVENERLPFPIAQIYLRLIEPPPAHRWFNGLFASRMFWIAVLAVLIVHSLNALNHYYPRYVPTISLGYNFRTLFNETLLKHTHWTFRANTMSFAIIAVTYFLQSKVAFSLWGFYILWQIVSIFYGLYQTEFPPGAENDQRFGAVVIFVLMTLWVGRHHWALVGRHMLRLRRPRDPQDPYLPYSLAGWGFVACLLGMFLWLRAVGVTVAGAIVLIAMLTMIMLTLSRVVAETGLIVAKVQVAPNRPWIYLSDLFPKVRTTPTTMFLTNWFHQLFAHDTRESLPVYSLHALRIADAAAYGEGQSSQRGWKFMAALALALVVGFAVAGASMLLVEYNYAEPLSRNASPPINPWGVDTSTKIFTLDPSVQYSLKGLPPAENHNRLGHFGFGLVFTTFLALMRLNFTWWPLHPVGFLLCYSDPISRCWLSILLGWLAKVLIVRFGGATLFKKAQPFFIGLLVGEAAAAAVWLIVSLVLSQLGLPYYPLHFSASF